MKRRKRKSKRNPSSTRTVISAIAGTVALGAFDYALARQSPCVFTNLNDEKLFASQLAKCQRVTAVRGALEAAVMFGAGYFAGGKQPGTVGRGLMWAAGIHAALVATGAVVEALNQPSAGTKLVTSATPAGVVTTSAANAPDANVPISFEV